MTSVLADQLVTVLVAMLSGGFLAALVQGAFQRKKLGAEYADVIARSATGLLQPLHERIQELEVEVEHERGRVRRLARDLDRANESLAAAREAVRLLTRELQNARKEV